MLTLDFEFSQVPCHSEILSGGVKMVEHPFCMTPSSVYILMGLVRMVWTLQCTYPGFAHTPHSQSSLVTSQASPSVRSPPAIMDVGKKPTQVLGAGEVHLGREFWGPGYSEYGLEGRGCWAQAARTLEFPTQTGLGIPSGPLSLALWSPHLLGKCGQKRDRVGPYKAQAEPTLAWV